MSDLAERSVAAAKWSSLFTVGRFGLQLAAQVVLARLLGPESFGVFGMALVVYTLSYFFATFGFAWGLAQIKEMGSDDIRFAFTWQVITGAIAGLVLYACAGAIADYYSEPRVMPVVHWMSLACVLNAASSVSAGVQRRQLAFKAMGMVQLCSYAVGYLLVGIPMAVAGFGVMSLVTAWLVQAAAALVFGLWACPHPVKPLFFAEQGRQLFSTGGAVLLTNLGNWALNNMDRLLIGRLLSTQNTGYYTVGYNLANLPNMLLLNALQPVFLAAGARLQDEPERLATAYRSTMAAVLVLLIPTFAVGCVLAPDLVLTIYGPGWAPSGQVLAILLGSVPAMAAWGISTPILWNTGRSFHEFWLQLPVLALGVAALTWAVPHGLVAAAWAATGIVVMRALVLCTAACRALRMTPLAFAPSLLRAALLSLPVALAAWAAPKAMALASDPLALTLQAWPAARLLPGAIASLLTASLMLWLWPMALGTQAAEMVVRFVPRAARWMKASPTVPDKGI